MCLTFLLCSVRLYFRLLWPCTFSRYREKAENLFGERMNHAYEIGEDELGMHIYGESNSAGGGSRRRESLYGDVNDGKV